MVGDKGLEDEVQKINTMTLQFGVFVLLNSKRVMNNFIHDTTGFFTNDVYYTDTKRLHIKKKRWNNLDKAGIFGKTLLQGKNDYRDGGVSMVFFSSQNDLLFNY